MSGIKPIIVVQVDINIGRKRLKEALITAS